MMTELFIHLILLISVATAAAAAVGPTINICPMIFSGCCKIPMDILVRKAMSINLDIRV